jgi:hypothetical protein
VFFPGDDVQSRDSVTDALGVVSKTITSRPDAVGSLNWFFGASPAASIQRSRVISSKACASAFESAPP